MARFLEADTIQKRLTEAGVPLEEFVKKMREVIKDSGEKKLKERFVNACTTISRFLKKYPQYLQEFKGVIAILIKTVEDDVGLVRKNAAVLLSNLARDETNKEIIRSLHGIELLTSVGSFL